MHDISPSDVVRQLFKHLSGREWRAAASLHSPEYLDRFVRQLRDRLAPRRAPRMTVEEYQRADPTMPREVAEWYAAKTAELPDVIPVGSFESAEELNELSPVDVVARHMEASDPRVAIPRGLERLRREYPQYADQLRGQEEIDDPWNVRVIGGVVDEARAYVLWNSLDASIPDDDMPEWGPRTIVLRATDQGWRVASDVAGGPAGNNSGCIQVEDPEGHRILLPLWTY